MALFGRKAPKTAQEVQATTSNDTAHYTALAPTSSTPLLPKLSSQHIVPSSPNNTNMEVVPFSPTMPNSPSSNPNKNEEEFQFYDPNYIFQISRDVAFGYWILLSGGTCCLDSYIPSSSGKAEYGTWDENMKQQASLTYTAIVDGNVLHTCFGLKTTGGSGSSKLTTNYSKTKAKIQHTIEVLREVGDFHHDLPPTPVSCSADTSSPTSLSSSSTRGLKSLYMEVIYAYIHLFASIVKYHDDKKAVLSKKSNAVVVSTNTTSNAIRDASTTATATTTAATNKSTTDSKPTKTPSCFHCLTHLTCCLPIHPHIFKNKKQKLLLSQMQQQSLQQVQLGFDGLREKIWERLELAATVVWAVSLEDS